MTNIGQSPLKTTLFALGRGLARIELILKTRGKQTNEETDERVISGKDRAVEIRPDRRSHPFQNVTKLWTKSIAPPYLCTFSGMICR